jgi:acyl dehydratase
MRTGVLDPKHIGLSGPAFDVPLERGKLREFATAIGAHLPDYLDQPDAVVPPTFLVMWAYFWGYLLERPGGTALKTIGADQLMSLDGGHSYIYPGAPPRIGQTLRACTEVEDIWTKQGRNCGRSSFIRMLSTFRDESGLVVAEWRPTSVIPEVPPAAAVERAAEIGADRPYMKRDEQRREFMAMPRQQWDDLSEGEGPGPIIMPPLTLTDIVRYQYASGEDSVAHHDEVSARAEGFPTFFSVGMLHAGLLSTYAVCWLGPERVRRFDARFNDMIWPGDELTYDGVITAKREEHGRRLVDVALSCDREGTTVTSATATFDLT